MHTEILSDLIIEKIHSISTMHTETGTNSKRKNRPSWALVVKYEGETIYSANEKKYLSDINNIAILPKGCDYNWCCTKSGHFSIIEFECQKRHNDIFSFNVKNGEAYLNTIKKMEVGRALKKPSYKLDELRDLYGIISSLVKTAEKKYIPSVNEQKILPVIEYIAKNYNKKLHNDELAFIAGTSTVYFRKLFKEVTGVSPINYIQFVKMKKAKEMLASDYSGITDIAYSLGYNNVYEFSRSFKKQVGISPKAYSNNILNKTSKEL